MVSEGPTPRDSLGTLSYHSLVQNLFANHIGLCVVLFVTVVFVRYARSPMRSVPPGPRGLPFLGNVLQVQDKKWMLGRDCKHAFSVFSLMSGRKSRH